MELDIDACWADALARGLPQGGALLVVQVETQTLVLFAAGTSIARYDVSTSRHGTGCVENSYQTPTGWHCVSDWIGDGLPPGAVLKGRAPAGIVLSESDWISKAPHDTITTRILWLDGMETGHNRGPGVDSHDRYIYIHGTNHENDIGQPASSGCVRMKNRDVLDLFNRTKDKATFVWIG